MDDGAAGVGGHGAGGGSVGREVEKVRFAWCNKIMILLVWWAQLSIVLPFLTFQSAGMLGSPWLPVHLDGEGVWVFGVYE